MSELLTQYKYYKQVQKNDNDAIIILREFDSCTILGNKNVLAAYPVIKEVLTHKDCGKMYCINTENYAYKLLSFGKHNLKKAIHALKDAGFRVVTCDYGKAFRDSGGWEEIDRINKAYYKRQAEYELKHRQPVQLTLFDLWGM